MEKIETDTETETKSVTETGTNADTETLDWKEIGNRAFQDKKYEEAISAYSEGLKVTPSDVSLLSNRALNYLNLESFHLALADAEAVLKMEPKHVKALYRKVKALIGTRKYRTAGEFILKDNHKSVLNAYTKDTKLGEELLSQIEKLLDQEVNGNYNMADILKEQTYEHLVGDYNAPLALEEVKGQGRVLITTEKVEAGQLLIGSKAYAFVVERKNRKLKVQDEPKEEGKEAPKGPRALVYEEGVLSISRTKVKEALVEAIVQKVKKSPEETQALYTLFAGSKLGHLDLGDIFSTVDIERIKKIVDCNALIADGRVTYEFKELMAGLWLFPAFVNHSCFDGNVKWHMHGDFLAVIATKDIAIGQELRMSYVSPHESLEIRQKILKSYEIYCHCTLCTFQRQETPEIQDRIKRGIKKYETLLEGAGSIVSTETTELEAIVTEMEGIHPGKLSLCPWIFEPYKVLARRYFRAGNFEKSIQILEKGRQLVVGTEFDNEMLTFTTNLISAHLKNKDKKKAGEWVEILKKDVRICYGNPVDQVLQIIAPDLVKKLKVEKILI